jgi:hypothetical protein
MKPGDRFLRLTVIASAGNGSWLCRCDCGVEKAVHGSNLTAERTRSCGCLAREKATLHGMAGTPTYKSWTGMKARCLDPDAPDYARYGGRGITVCERWLVLDSFLADMGPRPAGTSLDRIDNNGNYEPGNCRWASREVQANNKRDTRLLTHAGETLSISQWARKTGIERVTLSKRLGRGWSVERALTDPVEEQPWH